MSELAIDAHQLSKRFRIGGPKSRYVTLRENAMKFATSPLQSIRNAFQTNQYVWALDDVSFQVPRGEVLGIIGRNGAGKTTLLKVLSRITEPTRGFADVRGRIGSLLEVTTGFHPELTGRENIYLGGAVLGMRKALIDRRFDEIVAFAEVEKFVNTPVKRFSTGMALRLAFAVAAHLEADILLVDEVLAVGDADFQKRCLGRLGDVAHQGRTVLFVSHNLGAIRTICEKGMVLDRGRIVAAGGIAECLEEYYRLIGALSTGDGNDRDSVFSPIRIRSRDGNRVSQAEGFEVTVKLRCDPKFHGFTLFCRLEDMQARPIFRLRQESTNLGLGDRAEGDHTVSVKFPPLWLTPGLYSLDFAVAFWGEFHSEDMATSDKFPLDVDGRGSDTTSSFRATPILHPEAAWSIGKGRPSRGAS